MNIKDLQSLMNADENKVSITFNTNIGNLLSKHKFSDIIMSLLKPIPSKAGGVAVRILSLPFRYYVHYIRDNELNKISGKSLTVALHDAGGSSCQFCHINKPTERYVVLCYAKDYNRYVLYSLSATAAFTLRKMVTELMKDDANLKNWLCSFEKYSVGGKKFKPQNVRYNFQMVKHSVLDNNKAEHADQLWCALDLGQNIYCVDEAEEVYQEMVASMAW